MWTYLTVLFRFHWPGFAAEEITPCGRRERPSAACASAAREACTAMRRSRSSTSMRTGCSAAMTTAPSCSAVPGARMMQRVTKASAVWSGRHDGGFTRSRRVARRTGAGSPCRSTLRHRALLGTWTPAGRLQTHSHDAAGQPQRFLAEPSIVPESPTGREGECQTPAVPTITVAFFVSRVRAVRRPDELCAKLTTR